MSVLTFSLKPFRGRGPVPDIGISGSIDRRGDRFSIAYELLGDLSALSIPAQVAAPGRKDRLWEDTCLELLLGVTGSADYREFNLSPAGDWNVYRFASCREGMREEPAFASLPFDVRIEPGTLKLSLDVDIGAIVPADRTLDAAVCAVVKTKTGEVSHWALAHPGPRPDFHRRDGFTLEIPMAGGSHSRTDSR